MLAAFVAAFLSGSIGSGGGLLLLPVLSSILGVQLAVPMLTSVQIVSNASRACFSFDQIRWRALLSFILLAIPCTLIGGFAFVHLNKVLIMHMIGILLLVYLGINLLQQKDSGYHQSKKAFLPLAGLAGFLSGLIGTAGPLGPAAFMSLELQPLEFIATDAMCSLILHAVKIAFYQSMLNIPSNIWALSFLCALMTIVGSWCGRRLTQLLPQQIFRRVVMGSLAISSLLLIIRV